MTKIEFNRKALSDNEARIVEGLVGVIAEVYLQLAARLDVAQGHVGPTGSPNTDDTGPLEVLADAMNRAFPGIDLHISK